MSKHHVNPVCETPDQILEWYENLLLYSGRMVEKARDRNWSDLVSEQVQFVKFFERIARHECDDSFSPEQYERRETIISEVMARSSETQSMLRSRQRELVMSAANDELTEAIIEAFQNFSTPSGASVSVH